MDIQSRVKAHLANINLRNRLEREGYLKEAAALDYELSIEGADINRLVGRKLSWYDRIRLLRKKRKSH